MKSPFTNLPAQFDIKDFYPSIRTLLEKVLKFAEEYNKYYYDETWMKKDSGVFDVATGAFDGAEVCKFWQFLSP